MLPSASSCVDERTLLAFVSGQLAPERLRLVEAHIADCVACQRLVAQVATAPTQDGNTTSYLRDRSREPFVAREGRVASLPDSGVVLAGKYRVERLVGRGGMGGVVAATHLGLGQRVAIKILHLEGSDAQARFTREGRTLAQLDSPHIVRVYDDGQLDDGRPFIVMEYLQGADLAKVAAQGPFDIAAAVSYIRQACSALEVAHSAGIVPRALNPSNLFLVQRKPPLLKVLDFGVSKIIAHDEQSLTLTSTGMVIGSPRYMSPEQITAKEVENTSDIWSLGVILYELLTGRVPFDQTVLTTLTLAIATVRPKSPSAYRPEISAKLNQIVMRCLEKDPTRRFASVVELREALAPFEAPIVERPVPRMNKTLWALVGLVLAGLLGVMAFLMRGGPQTAVETRSQSVIRAEVEPVSDPQPQVGNDSRERQPELPTVPQLIAADELQPSAAAIEPSPAVVPPVAPAKPKPVLRTPHVVNAPVHSPPSSAAEKAVQEPEKADKHDAPPKADARPPTTRPRVGVIRAEDL